jgi:membrane-associated phospholipid phosphatase
MVRPPDRRRQGPALGEPVTEEFVGDRDLTRWSRLGRWLELLAFRTSHGASAHAVLVISSAVGAILVLGLTALSAEIYEDVKNSDGLSSLDLPVLNLAVSLRTPTNVAVVQFFTNLGGALELTIITAVILVIMMVRWRSWTPLILLLIGVSGSLLMTVAGKNLVGRARPPEVYAVPPYETSPSFPSGHTLNSTVIASLVAYLLLLHLASRLARVVSVVCAVVWFVAMGLSRVFLGYHWLTDVIVGWTLGLAWVALVITSHRLFLTVRRERREQNARTDLGKTAA